MLNPVFIWLISNFVLLAIVCNAPQTIAMATVLLMITNFVMIIPIFIILRKKSAEYRKSQFKTINAEFEVKDDKVYLNGREAVITFFHAEDGIQVLSVCSLPRKTQKTDTQNEKNAPEHHVQERFLLPINGI